MSSTLVLVASQFDVGTTPCMLLVSSLTQGYQVTPPRRGGCIRLR